jgi:hypothetical protein
MLARAHIVFIVVCIAFCALFAVVQLRAYRTEGDAAALIRGLLSLVVATALVFYVRKFSRESGPQDPL